MIEQKISICRFCEGDCGTIVTVEDGRPIEIKGDKDHPVSRGYTCGKQRAMMDITNDPDRIVQPMKRVAGKLEPISWSQALQEIGAKVRKIKQKGGGDALGMYMGNPFGFSYSMAISIAAFQGLLGIKNAWSAGSMDCQNKFFASELMFGSALYQPYPDVERTDCLIILGGNPVLSGGSFINFPRAGERLKEIDRRGKLYVIDPRRTETAKTAGEHIFIRPDTDLFFLMSMLNLIFKDPRFDRVAVNRVAEGLELLEAAVEPYSPKVTEKITGIKAAKVAEITGSFLEHTRAALYNRLGTDLGTFPTFTDWLVKAVNLVAGKIDVPGGMVFSKGMVGVGRLGHRMGMRNGTSHSRIRGFPSNGSFFPAGVMADEILTPGAGQVRALFLICGNPVITGPNGAHLKEALKDLDLFVAIDFYENDTAVHADYILPAATSLEREEINLVSGNFQPIPYVQYVGAALSPRGEARQDWQILRDLSIVSRVPARISNRIVKWIDWVPHSPKLLAVLFAASRGVNPIKLRRNPHGLKVEGPHYKQVLGKKVLTENGLVDLNPGSLEGIVEQVQLRFDALKKKRNKKNELLMISVRDRRSQNSWIHNCPSMMNNRKGNTAVISRKDAGRLDIETGDIIQVMNQLAQIELPVKITDDLMAGVIIVPHGWGHDPESGWRLAASKCGVNSNLLCDDQTLEQPSGHPLMNGISVQVKKVIRRWKI